MYKYARSTTRGVYQPEQDNDQLKIVRGLIDMCLPTYLLFQGYLMDRTKDL